VGKDHGISSPNFLIDLPFVRIIAVAPDGDLPPDRSGTLSPATSPGSSSG
jgi:hypothetical protein